MDACDIALQACHALAEAHRLGVVHRDIKPANLFLTTRRDGSPHVKVVDFGLAPLVSSQVAGPSLGPGKTWRVAGSPGYAAPEQIGSQRSVDERADVWGLGIVLYELVLGRRPFGGETLIDALIAAGSDPVPPMGAVPKDFEAIVRRCLEKDRERRFPNMAALAEALAPLAPPALADYPDLVRIAAGGAFTSAESTQRLLVDDEGARSSVPSRANSALDGAHGAPPSSRGRADATGTDALRVADGTSSFIAQVVPVEAPPWAGFVAVVLACTVALSIVISHAESHRPQVAPASQAPPSSSSMLLPPLPKSGGSATPHESNSDWEAAGRDWQEAH
jgi:serine/threonine-protein kinase